MQKRIISIIPWFVFFIALLLLISHTLTLTQITIDGTTLILLGILLICPFFGRIRKLKLGELEAEIAPEEVKKIVHNADKYMNNLEVPRSTSVPEIGAFADDLRDLLDRDHVLALAKLRMELESALKRLYALSVPESKRNQKQTNLITIAITLKQSGVLPNQIFTTFREVILVCNRAVHGEYIRPRDAGSIIDTGIQIIEYLVLTTAEYITSPIETTIISQSEVKEYQDAKYRVVTVTPLVENPERNIRILDQEGIDMLLEGYNEYAEFVISLEKMDSTESETIRQPHVP